MPEITKSAVRFEPASDNSFLLYFDDPSPSPVESGAGPDAAFENVRRLVLLLETSPITEIRNLHPAYDSVLVKFDALQCDHQQISRKLAGLIRRLQDVVLPPSRSVEIPVCYGGDYGPDLCEVARIRGLTPERVVELHSSASYVVYFLGFVPGFAYLGELPTALSTPRLDTPRRKVPAGSVGIAGSQTAVYPMETPGGWHLLGRTPLDMFRADGDGLSLLAIGDRVHFKPVTPKEFESQLQKKKPA
jgi:inhibitor of KinA